MIDLLKNFINLTDPEKLADLGSEELAYIPFHTYSKDRKGRYLGGNDYLAKDVGFKSAAQLLDHTDYDLWPNDAPLVKINDDKVMKLDKNIIYLETGNMIITGGQVKVISHKMPLRTRSKKVIGIMGLSFILKKDSDVFVDTSINQKNKKILHSSHIPKLTKRQFDCIYYLIKGMTQKEIAKILKISPRTVESYLDDLKIKFKCYSRSELIAMALKLEPIRNRLLLDLCW